jgi:hypothetical protein
LGFKKGEGGFDRQGVREVLEENKKFGVYDGAGVIKKRKAMVPAGNEGLVFG